jgi:hypothetical protein
VHAHIIIRVGFAVAGGLWEPGAGGHDRRRFDQADINKIRIGFESSLAHAVIIGMQCQHTVGIG